MENRKNTLVLTIIAVATLLVAVAGATFAYFAGTVNNSNVVNASITTGAANLVFTSTGGSISLTVDAANMTNNTVGHTFTSTNQNLNVTLSGGDSNTSCSYNIYYKWTTQNYTKSAGVSGTTKELTLSIGDALTETQIANSSTTPNKVTSNKKTIKSGKTDTYKVEAKFYNLSLDQSAQASKTFTVDVYVADVVC